MKPIRRLGGIASLLLLVSLFSPASASTKDETNTPSVTNATLDDRISAV